MSLDQLFHYTGPHICFSKFQELLIDEVKNLGTNQELILLPTALKRRNNLNEKKHHFVFVFNESMQEQSH